MHTDETILVTEKMKNVSILSKWNCHWLSWVLAQAISKEIDEDCAIPARCRKVN